jgi:hypothetical protein
VPEPAKPIEKPPAEKPAREKDKSDLVHEAMQPPHRLPSYVAWDMTIPELTELLKKKG